MFLEETSNESRIEVSANRNDLASGESGYGHLTQKPKCDEYHYLCYRRSIVETTSTDPVDRQRVVLNDGRKGKVCRELAIELVGYTGARLHQTA